MQLIAESCFGPAGVLGRFRVLAAGEGSIGGTSILLFERDAYGLSGGQTIVRVQDAPRLSSRQGDRCAAPASAQPRHPSRTETAFPQRLILQSQPVIENKAHLQSHQALQIQQGEMSVIQPPAGINEKHVP